MDTQIKQFKDIFPSLLSNLNSMPPSIQVCFSMTDSSLKARNEYLEAYINRLNKISDLSPKYLRENPTEIPFFEIIVELSNWIDLEQRVRLGMRKLVYMWLQKKYQHRCLSDNDPWTMSPPVHCIRIFDAKSRGYYQFEANSLRKHIESCLGYAQWLFPAAYVPKNPLTNIPFHEGQLLSILKQLRSYGYGSWMIEAYKAANWNLKRFAIDNSIQVKLYALNQVVKNPNDELYEMLEDFIDDQYEENRIPKKKALVAVKWAVREMLGNEYMQKWLKLFHDYYKLKYRYNIESSNDIMLRSIYVRSMQLFDDNAAISVLANKRQIENRKKMEETVIHPSLVEYMHQIEANNILHELINQIIAEPIETSSSEDDMTEPE